MSAAATAEVPLVAASPYDLRVSLGEKVSETDMRAALESGECGFVHSFTTGSAVDGPGVRVVAWLAGCQFKCATFQRRAHVRLADLLAKPDAQIIRTRSEQRDFWIGGDSTHFVSVAPWKVRLTTSICCSFVSRTKFTA